MLVYVCLCRWGVWVIAIEQLSRQKTRAGAERMHRLDVEYLPNEIGSTRNEVQIIPKAIQHYHQTPGKSTLSLYPRQFRIIILPQEVQHYHCTPGILISSYPRQFNIIIKLQTIQYYHYTPSNWKLPFYPRNSTLSLYSRKFDEFTDKYNIIKSPPWFWELCFCVSRSRWKIQTLFDHEQRANNVAFRAILELACEQGKCHLLCSNIARAVSCAHLWRFVGELTWLAPTSLCSDYDSCADDACNVMNAPGGVYRHKHINRMKQSLTCVMTH